MTAPEINAQFTLRSHAFPLHVRGKVGTVEAVNYADEMATVSVYMEDRGDLELFEFVPWEYLDSPGCTERRP